MNAAGHSATAPNESDFSIKDHLYLKMGPTENTNLLARSSEGSSVTNTRELNATICISKKKKKLLSSHEREVQSHIGANAIANWTPALKALQKHIFNSECDELFR